MKERISAIICTKDEGRSISQVIKEVKRYVDEILVIDSKYSCDDTRSIARALGARVLVDRGVGKGEAVRIGIREARGDLLVFIDGDGSHKAQDIPALLRPIVEGKADLVIASRRVAGSEDSEGALFDLLRWLFGVLITLLINVRWNSRLTDSQNGFRAIRKKVALALHLKAGHFDIETEMTMKCLKRGYEVREIPSRELRRRFGKSRLSLLRHGPRYAQTVLGNLF
jgi:glycosyltransferase involved in cell wall biosynthesis